MSPERFDSKTRDECGSANTMHQSPKPKTRTAGKRPGLAGPGGSDTDQGCLLKAEITSFAADNDMIENFHVKKFTGIDKHCCNLFIG
jgi:hypothetical protein